MKNRVYMDLSKPVNEYGNDEDEDMAEKNIQCNYCGDLNSFY